MDMISGMEDSTSQMVFKCLKIQDLPFTFPKLGGKWVVSLQVECRVLSYGYQFPNSFRK